MKLPALRRARELRGFTQPVLADAAGVSLRTIVNIEHGKEARPSTASKLAEALRVEITVLAGVDPFPTTRHNDAPETPKLELVALFNADPAVRRRALKGASSSEIRRYLANLNRAREHVPKELDEGDTEDTRRQLIEYGRRLGQMQTEAEVFGSIAHADVVERRGA